MQRLSSRSRFDQKNFTINHLVEIVRGTKSKKVIGCQWDTDPLYNDAASRGQRGTQDCHRIIRQLVLRGYLREDLVVSKDGMAVGYVKPGPKAPLGSVQPSSLSSQFEFHCYNFRQMYHFISNCISIFNFEMFKMSFKWEMTVILI